MKLKGTLKRYIMLVPSSILLFNIAMASYDEKSSEENEFYQDTYDISYADETYNSDSNSDSDADSYSDSDADSYSDSETTMDNLDLVETQESYMREED